MKYESAHLWKGRTVAFLLNKTTEQIMGKKKIFELHAEHKDWLNRLDFHKADIKFLVNRVAEISSKNTEKEVTAMCDHYTNLLEIHLNEAQKLKHAIKKHEHLVEQELSQNPVAVDHRRMEDHEKERLDIEKFEQLYSAQRNELLRFCSKWM
jgi:transposase